MLHVAPLNKMKFKSEIGKRLREDQRNSSEHKSLNSQPPDNKPDIAVCVSNSGTGAETGESWELAA